LKKSIPTISQRGLDQARRRIVELEREIKRLKGASTTPQIDHSVIDYFNCCRSRVGMA
jgi:hypothetical protein